MERDVKRKNNFEKKGLIWILTINGDHPQDAMPIDLRYRWDQKVLAYLKQRYVVCQFRDRVAYGKGKRLVGQHRSGQSIPIGRFRSLVKPLGYKSQPLSQPKRRSGKSTEDETSRSKNWPMTGTSRRAISGPFWDKTNLLFGLLKASETKGFLRVNLR